MDKYEASAWYVPPDEKNLIAKIQKGTASADDLANGGAIHLQSQTDLATYGCVVNGSGCVDVYALSVSGATPAGFVSWYQATALARNSHKRLATNQEWQAAAFGTPDGLPCNVAGGPGVLPAGHAPGCVSNVGALDMVGNVWEFVAE